MPGYDIDLNIDGLDLAEAQHKLLQTALLDLRPFWPKVARLYISWISLNFDTEGAYAGDPWEPLSPEYFAWKTARYPGKMILSAEGDLRRAATTPRRIVSERELVLEIEPYSKRDGTLIGPEWFQEGTTRMPARPLLFDLTPIMEEQLEQAGSDYVDEILDALGL